MPDMDDQNPQATGGPPHSGDQAQWHRNGTPGRDAGPYAQGDGGRFGRARGQRRAGQAGLPQVITRGDMTVLEPEPDLSQVVMRQTSWQYQRHIMDSAGADDLDAVRPTEYLAILRRGWFVLILVPLVAAASAFWLISGLAKTYTATATMLVSLPGSTGIVSAAGGPEFSSDIGSANLLARTYSKLVVSPPILERVIERLELADTPPKLASRVKPRNEADTQIITVTTEDPRPEMATAISNAVAEEFVAWVDQQEQGRIARSGPAVLESLSRARASVEAITAEIASIRNLPGNRNQDERNRMASLEALRQQHLNSYNALVELQQRTERLRLTAHSPITIVSLAQSSLAITGRSMVISLLGAILLGLAVAATGLVVRDRLDRRVRSPRDVQREVDLPVLASVPRTSRSSRVELVAAPLSRTSEIFRSLRTKLRFAVDGQGLGAVAVTGPESDQSISTVAANLAVALAQAGHRVVLIDANLRRPRQHKLFRLPSGPGLSDLLSGEVRPRGGEPLADWGGEIIRPTSNGSDFESILDRGSEIEGLLVDGPVPRLRLLLAGTCTQVPADVLSSETLEQITTVLGVVADVMVIDTPALRGSSDAMLIASAADHAVLVVDAGRTKPDDLGTASANIASTGVNVLGVVLHGVERGAAAA